MSDSFINALELLIDRHVILNKDNKTYDGVLNKDQEENFYLLKISSQVGPFFTAKDVFGIAQSDYPRIYIF